MKGKLDIFDANRPILVFANITAGGFGFSTPVIVRQPLKLGAASGGGVPSRLLFQIDAEGASTGFLRQGGGFSEKKELTVAEGPLGLKGICGDELVTFKSGDSRHKATSDSLLQMTLSAEKSQEIEIYLIDAAGGEYFCQKRIAAGQWVTFSLSAAEFKSQRGTADFSLSAGIKIKGKGLLLNSLLWV